MAKVTMAMIKEFGEKFESQGNLRTERGRNREYAVNGDFALQPKEREFIPAGIGRRATPIKVDVKATSESDILASAMISAPEELMIETVKDTGTVPELMSTFKVLSRLAKDAGIYDEYSAAIAKRLSAQVATASKAKKTPAKKTKKEEGIPAIR